MKQTKKLMRWVEAAIKEYPELFDSTPYYFIQVTLPKGFMPERKTRTQVLTHPAGLIPVVPVDQKVYAEMLLGMFAGDKHNKKFKFEILMTDKQRLDEMGNWYVYGESVPTIDRICKHCGAIAHGYPGLIAPCPTCRRSCS